MKALPFLISLIALILVSGGLGCSQCKSDQGVLVTLVVDGDTIEIEGGARVRYLGIDAPEPAEDFGVESYEMNKTLVEGKIVTLEADVQDKDSYGRLLRYVYLDGEMINAKLVEEGYAYSYSREPNVKYQVHFIKLEKKARDSKLGLWG